MATRAERFNAAMRARPWLLWSLIALIGLFWLPQVGSALWQALDRETTSRNVSVKVLAEPYVGSDVLIYEWSGNVFRSCGVTIERMMVDASGYVHRLKPTKFPPLPETELGLVAFPIKVETPLNLPAGQTTYYSAELSRCGWFQKWLWPARLDYPPVTFIVTHPDN